MKNVLLIHGFNGCPKIFFYFKEELEKLGFNVILPNFPVREEISVDGYFEVFDKYRGLFNDNLIVVAHSIGNPMFIKYIYENNLKVGEYFSLAGFHKEFYNEGKDVLNEKVKLTVLTTEELSYIYNLSATKYSIYSNSDHLVPFELLKQFSRAICSKPLPMDGIGHMGKKSGLEKLPEVINLIK